MYIFALYPVLMGFIVVSKPYHLNDPVLHFNCRAESFVSAGARFVCVADGRLPHRYEGGHGGPPVGARIKLLFLMGNCANSNPDQNIWQCPNDCVVSSPHYILFTHSTTLCCRRNGRNFSRHEWPRYIRLWLTSQGAWQWQTERLLQPRRPQPTHDLDRL